MNCFLIRTEEEGGRVRDLRRAQFLYLIFLTLSMNKFIYRLQISFFVILRTSLPIKSYSGLRPLVYKKFTLEEIDSRSRFIAAYRASGVQKDLKDSIETRDFDFPMTTSEDYPRPRHAQRISSSNFRGDVSDIRASTTTRRRQRSLRYRRLCRRPLYNRTKTRKTQNEAPFYHELN